MSRMPEAVIPRLRFALAVMVGGIVALLTPSLLATTVDARAVVLAALMVALAAAGLSHHGATFATRALASPPRASNDVPVHLAGRVTDPVHHPIRPRAPGMA
jgi:hypothetical protein